LKKILRVILWDQLSLNMTSLRGINAETDVILLAETKEEATFVKHHKKKIALLWSSMRHFKKDLESKGFKVSYVKYTDKENTQTLEGEITRAVQEHKPHSVFVSTPGDYRSSLILKDLKDSLDISLNILKDERFLCSIDEFSDWAKGKKALRMEFFYREMRRKHNILMDGKDPVGGQWNYDSNNRKRAPDDLEIPKPYGAEIDEITQEVIDLVASEFKDHFGDLEPFYFAVTREQALGCLDKFIKERLDNFGDYQDAMVQKEPWMFHSHISFYLNAGLLDPLECIQAAEKAYSDNKAPLNAVEGFIRQILGWREYVRGIYWTRMPSYKDENFLEATRALPDFFWDGETKMNCLRQCITETKENAYAHHIQRLMVLGNFLLLAGVDPQEVNEWYLIVYADAYEWVELPNVTGMILFADGGVLASKPYSSSGSYINKMSNYCKKCAYKVTVKNGPDACPFNYLYWNFLLEHQEKLGKNPRLSMPYNTLKKMSDEKKEAIIEDSKSFFNTL
jgi:deoxyribodipyrimidine photolyase-related protein